jgi:hypothetical protein
MNSPNLFCRPSLQIYLNRRIDFEGKPQDKCHLSTYSLCVCPPPLTLERTYIFIKYYKRIIVSEVTDTILCSTSKVYSTVLTSLAK